MAAISRTARLLFCACCAAAASVVAGVPAASARDRVHSPAEVDAVLDAILAAPEEQAAINRFIGAGDSPATELADRARILIRALRGRRGTLDATTYINAVGRVTGLASRALGSTSVIQLAVSDDYRPDSATLALDFGPPDGAVMGGFDRVVPGDPRITGASTGLRRPDTNALLADGIVGISRIALRVRSGGYRVVLMTQNLGDPRLANLPFGREVRINGQPARIERSAFDQWAPAALLAPRADRAAADARDEDGYLTGIVPAGGAALFRREQGGAVIVEGRASQGELVIELVGIGRARSYLTGLLVEPLDRVSDIVLSRRARRALVPLDERLSLEALVLGDAATAVQGLEPALGQTLLGDTVASQDN